MRQIKEVLNKYELKPHRYIKSGKVFFIDTVDGRYAVKEKNTNNDIFKYLNTRNFNYYPKILSSAQDDYEITEYIDETPIPNEQKMLDLIDITSLLHNKTTHFKEIDEDEYKQIYEDVKNNIEYLKSYYNDIITIIETKVYMSPSEYLLARNISKVYNALNYCDKEIEAWYKLIEGKRKKRQVVLHNNLEINHFIRNNSAYLTSWNKSKIDIPIFDLYKLYKKHAIDYDFTEILKRYEKNYPLKEYERKLLFILMVMPDKLEFVSNQYMMCKKISEFIDYIYKTESLISPYYSETKPQNPQTD